MSGGDEGQVVEGKPHARLPVGVRSPVFIFSFNKREGANCGRVCPSWVGRGPSGAPFSSLGIRVF